MTVPADFTRFAAAHAAGEVLSGRVVKVVAFGAFVEMAEGVHGLLAGAEPAEGTDVRVRILDIDTDKQRMSLRLA
jgi:ribosomal protein S1